MDWSLDWGVEFVVATYGLLGGLSVALTMVATKTPSNQKRQLKRVVIYLTFVFFQYFPIFSEFCGFSTIF